MKKLISIIGMIILAIIILLNTVFTAYMDSSEHITISLNNPIFIIGLLSLVFLLIFATYKIDKYLNKDSEKYKKIRKIVLIVALCLYILFSILWVVLVRPAIVGDQIHGANLAQTFYSGNTEEFLPNKTYSGITLSEYMQAHHHQITLSFVFSLFFRLIHFDGIAILRVLNVIGNALIVFSLYKIGQILSKKYNFNKVLFFTLILTFISLPMLNTFIYGDMLSIGFCLFSVYLIMKYAEEKKIKYILISAVLTAFAYMLRMNSLIFIIATVMYLILNIFKQKGNAKDIVINLMMIIVYIAISIIPAKLVADYYLNKFNLDRNKEYPMTSYILMAMEEGPRGNGWYNEEIGEYALKNPEQAKEEYPEKIKERLKYFAHNIGYTCDFYIKKVASMWCENTYSAVWNNEMGDISLGTMTEPLLFYQKALLLIMCVCSLVVVLQNIKDISLEMIFLILIFIGGFLFHVIWEAKSRYILPYILVLIPIASIYMKKLKK